MSRVVVTGIGAVTPIGNSAVDFWDGLKNGKNGIDKITKFDTEGFKAHVAAEVKDFDPHSIFEKAFISKTDLYTQYALYSAEEAVKDSGILGNIDEDEFGVYYGSGVGGINTLCEEHEHLLNKGPRRVNPQFVAKMIINIAAGQIAIRYNAHGSAMSMSTACATGTTTIGEAYRAIKDGYLKAAICGGSEAAITPVTVAGFSNCMALTTSEDKDAASLPFDKRRGGFVIGEGAATLILEDYDNAVKRGAHIYAEVVGYGATCDAHHITAPNPEAEYVAKAIEMALKGLDVKAEELYINAHGTGTALNDATETTAFKKVYKDDAYKLAISSTKSMTGHMLGAAGAAEAIACIKALEEGIIPPTINLNEPDEALDLNYTPNKAEKRDVKYAISTSLGFGGHNSCIAFKKFED